jgi:ribosomal protein S1
MERGEQKAGLPNLDDIIRDPHGAKVPTRMDIAVAVLYALIGRITDKTVGNILTFLARNPIEIAMAAFMDVCTQKPELVHNKVVQEWMDAGEIIEVQAYDANRGGMLIEYEGVRGFLPVSQLSAEHYPRVGSADKDEILQRLNSLIGQPLKVRILDADRKTNKLIFSEKEAVKDGLAARFEKLAIGDSVKGVVTGVVDFGAFVNVDGIEGLVHISEISWERVNSPADYVKVGDTIEAKIISIDKDRLSLSMKQLTKDPWLDEVEKFNKLHSKDS